VPAVLDSSYRDAGDCETLGAFFFAMPPIFCGRLIGGFRTHADAITAVAKRNTIVIREIIEREVNSLQRAGQVKFLYRVNDFMRRIPKFAASGGTRPLRPCINPGIRLAAVIEYQGDKWAFR